MLTCDAFRSKLSSYSNDQKIAPHSKNGQVSDQKIERKESANGWYMWKIVGSNQDGGHEKSAIYTWCSSRIESWIIISVDEGAGRDWIGRDDSCYWTLPVPRVILKVMLWLRARPDFTRHLGIHQKFKCASPVLFVINKTPYNLTQCMLMWSLLRANGNGNCDLFFTWLKIIAVSKVLKLVSNTTAVQLVFENDFSISHMKYLHSAINKIL